MRRRSLPLFLALSLVAIPGQAAAIGTLDQEVLPGNSAACVPQYKAQTFTAGLTGSLDTVALMGGSSNYGPNWNIEIRGVTAGSPNATVLATGSAAWNNAWADIALTPAPSVQAGQTYAIVSTTTPCWRWAANAYGGGAAFSSNDGVSWANTGLDVSIRTFVTAAPPVVTPPTITLTVSHLVSATSDGTYASSLTAPAGSEAWHKVEVKNTSETGLIGLSISDASGKLPAGCPAIPAPLAIGATYTCTYHAPVAAGTTTDTVTAAFGIVSATGSVTLTGTGAEAGSIGTKLGLPGAAGAYSASTKVAPIGTYVTWRADLGADAAGATIGVEVATKAADGTWSPFTRLTGRKADGAGVVTFSWRASSATWQSVRFSGGGSTSTASQARWR